MARHTPRSVCNRSQGMCGGTETYRVVPTAVAPIEYWNQCKAFVVRGFDEVNGAIDRR